MPKETHQNEGCIITQEELEGWIFKGIKKPHHSRKNIFQDGADYQGAYDQFVAAGGIDRMEEEELAKLKAKRLEQISPTEQYVRLDDWSLGSVYGKKQLVAQYGRSNRYVALEDLLTQAGLHRYEITVYSSEESGSGYSSSHIILRIWMLPGDKSRKIYATDFIRETQGAHTGDILGGPNSMHSGFSFGERDVRVQASLLGETHLAFISTSPIAQAIRSLF